MSNSRGIFRSNKSIAPEAEVKKVQLQVEINHQQTPLQDENVAPQDNSENTTEKVGQRRVLLIKSKSSENRDSCKTIKSRSCLKKEHSRCEQEDETKSVKSIKFKPDITNVFEYSLPQRSLKLSREEAKKLSQRRQKVEEQCCYIY